MARLRLKVELKEKDRDIQGVSLAKLAKAAEEFQKLLRMVAQDVRIATLESSWIAHTFREGSLGFDTEHLGEADEGQARSYLQALEQVTQLRGKDPMAFQGVRPETLYQCAVLANVMEPGDIIKIGFYLNGSESVKWNQLLHSDAAAVIEKSQSSVEYHGMVQGIIHTLYKEAHPRYFSLRELSTQARIKCLFNDDKYPDVVGLLKQKSAVVLISGTVRAMRIGRRIESILVERMEVAQPAPAIEDFRGSAPGFTGDLTTEEFIGSVRGDDE